MSPINHATTTATIGGTQWNEDHTVTGGVVQVIGPFPITWNSAICTAGVTIGPSLPSGTVILQVNAVVTALWTFTNTVQSPSLVIYFTTATANNLTAFADSFGGARFVEPFGAEVAAGISDTVLTGDTSNFAVLAAPDQLNAFINVNGGGTATAGTADIYALVQYP